MVRIKNIIKIERNKVFKLKQKYFVKAFLITTQDYEVSQKQCSNRVSEKISKSNAFWALSNITNERYLDRF